MATFLNLCGAVTSARPERQIATVDLFINNRRQGRIYFRSWFWGPMSVLPTIFPERHLACARELRWTLSWRRAKYPRLQKHRSELGLSIFQWPGLHYVSECASWSAPFANALAQRANSPTSTA